MGFLDGASGNFIDDISGIKDIPKKIANTVVNTVDKIKTDGLDSYVTGRSVDDNYLVDNSDLTVFTIDSLKGLAKSAETVNSLVEDSVKSLNNINGVQELLDGGVDSDALAAILKSISNNIDSLGNGLNAMHERALAFSNASFAKAMLATKLMETTVVVEGFLGILEDIGDLAFGIVGWLVPKDSKVEKVLSEWAKFEWVHYLADKAYYSTDLAKSASFTEDSLIGKANKFGGSILSFGEATKVIGGTVKAAAKVAGVVGAGAETERKLQEGYDIDTAFGAGVETGAKDAILFLLLGEGVKKVKKAKTGIKEYDTAKLAEAEAKEITIERSDNLASETKKLNGRYGKEEILKGAETKARNSDAAVAAQETTVSNSQKAVEAAEKAEAQSAMDLDQANKKLGTSTLDSKVETLTDELSSLESKTIKTKKTREKIEELRSDIETTQSKQESLITEQKNAQSTYENDSKALDQAKNDLAEAEDKLDKLKADNIKKHESVERAEKGVAEQQQKVDQAVTELDEAVKAHDATVEDLKVAGEKYPFAKNVDELGAVKGTAKTVKEGVSAGIESTTASVKEIPGKIKETLSKPKDYIEAKTADDSALKAETEAKAAYDGEVSKLDAAQESQRDLSNILENKKAEFHNLGYDAKIDELKGKIGQLDDKKIKLPGTSSKKRALVDARNELIGDRDAFIRNEINPAQANLEKANATVADQQVKVDTARMDYAEAIDAKLQTSEALAKAGEKAPLLRNIDESGLIKGTGKTIGNTLSSGINNAISNYGVGTPISTSSSMVIKGGTDAFDSVDKTILNTNDGNNTNISQITDNLTPDRIVVDTTPEHVYNVEKPEPISDITPPVSNNYGGADNGSSNAYQYSQTPDDLSGEATEGVTVDNPDVTSGETGKSWATYDPENGYDSLENQQARLAKEKVTAMFDKLKNNTGNEDLSGTATDGVTVDDPSVTPGETGKSWATYDPENGYDSLENQQARLAKEKVTAMFDKLKNNTGNENISGTATDGVTVENPSVIPSDARKSWATYDPVNGYDSLEEQQARLAREREAALNNPVKPSITTPGSESTNPVSVNPETNLNDKQTIVTPPSDTSSSSGTTYHSGGGYTPPASSSYNNQSSYVAPTPEPTPTPEPVQEPVVETPKPEVEKPVEDIVPKESKVTKIPTVTPPNNTKEVSSGGGGSRIIPIAAGIGAAAAAGLGAKAYLDRKENTDNGEEDEWDTEVDEGDKPIDINYEDKPEEGESVLEDDDEYTASDEEEIVERYDARANDELADLQ